MHKQNTPSTGFTIVELLIVIVVIAILAAISVVAYRGIQERAKNTQTISSVSQAIKSISAYIALNGAYPATSSGCLVPGSDGNCTAYNTTPVTPSSSLQSAINTVSTVPTTVPDAHPAFNGITYNYTGGRTYNGESRPLAVIYSLQGPSQSCGLPNVADNGGTTMVTPSSRDYTGHSGGYTYCFISVPGP